MTGAPAGVGRGDAGTAPWKTGREIVAYVRAGRGVAYLPRAAIAAITPRGVTFVPVEGVPPGEVVLAWDADRPPPHISGLLSAAQAGGRYGWRARAPSGT